MADQYPFRSIIMRLYMDSTVLKSIVIKIQIDCIYSYSTQELCIRFHP